MHTPFESSFETEGFDEQTRSQYRIGALDDLENGTPLHGLYRYWASSALGPHGLPKTSDFRPKSHLPPSVAAWVSWVDTSAEDPMDFVINDHIDTSIPGFGADLSGRKFCEISYAQLHITACAMEYLSCKHERVAMFHEIDQILCGYKRHYTRLMVPVVDTAGVVDRVYFAARLVRATRPVATRSSEEA